MMKFFRKHNKTLLAIFMSGLMIVFIGGSALQGFLTPQSDQVIATSIFGNISLLDQQEAKRVTDILDQVGQDWSRPISGAPEPLQTMEWILLAREAERYGVGVNIAEVRASTVSDQILSQLEFLSRRLRVRADVIRQAVAQFRAVQSTAWLVAGSALPSESELRIAARNVLEEVQIRTVVLPAQAFVDEAAEFTDAEIDAHFEAYRQKEPGLGLNFGYFLPPELKVQYVKIDRDAIKETIGVANLERKAKTYYEKTRGYNFRFRRPAEEIAETDSAGTGDVAGPPSDEVPPYMDWEDAKPAAIDVLKEQYADEAAERMAAWLAEFVAEDWLVMDRGEDGYNVVPESAKSMDIYDKMLERMPPSLRFPGSVTTAVSDLFNYDDAQSVPGIGMSAFRPERGAFRTFRAVAFKTKAIVPTIPQDSGVNPYEYLAPYQTCRYALRDSSTGDYYVFRVVGSRAGRPAESVDVVRDRLLADMRLQRGFELAKERAGSLKDCAGYDSLKEAYEGDLELVAFRESGESINSGFFDPGPFTRVQRRDAARGRGDRGVYVGPGVGTLSNDVVDQCFALAEADQKIVAIELLERAAVLLVEWVETIRADEDDFNELKTQLFLKMADARLQAAISDWLDPEQIRARTGFALVTDR